LATTCQNSLFAALWDSNVHQTFADIGDMAAISALPPQPMVVLPFCRLASVEMGKTSDEHDLSDIISLNLREATPNAAIS
jgi:hypothetical protein